MGVRAEPPKVKQLDSERAAPPENAYGVLAEFETPGELLHAAEAIRDAGYQRWDCFSPFPVHGLDKAMGLRDTRLPWVVLVAGLTGVGVAILMQWWMNAKDYPYLISGKPMFSLPANIPITFEVTVLFSAFTAVFCVFAFNKLPQFYHPCFKSWRFKRVTNDRFFVAIEAKDPAFDPSKTQALLRKLGSRHVEWLED